MFGAEGLMHVALGQRRGLASTASMLASVLLLGGCYDERAPIDEYETRDGGVVDPDTLVLPACDLPGDGWGSMFRGVIQPCLEGPSPAGTNEHFTLCLIHSFAGCASRTCALDRGDGGVCTRPCVDETDCPRGAVCASYGVDERCDEASSACYCLPP